MRRALLLLLLVMACSWTGNVLAQPDLSRRVGVTVADQAIPGWRFERLTAEATATGRRYRLTLAIPTGQAPDPGHPLAWLLDGNAALMDLRADTLARLAKAPSPPVIVFIAHDNDLRIDGDARAFDYTPRRAGDETSQRDSQAGRRNGGADAFLDFIQNEALAAVARRVKVDAKQQALWGHSYGGVFVLHALFTRPDAFQRFGAADPSLWWGDGYLLKEENAARDWTGNAPSLHLWIGEGAKNPSAHASPPPGARDPAAVDAMRRARQSVPPDATPRMAERLRARGLPVTLDSLAGLSHGQTLGASLPLFLDEIAGGSPAPVTQDTR